MFSFSNLMFIPVMYTIQQTNIISMIFNFPFLRRHNNRRLSIIESKMILTGHDWPWLCRGGTCARTWWKVKIWVSRMDWIAYRRNRTITTKTTKKEVIKIIKKKQPILFIIQFALNNLSGNGLRNNNIIGSVYNAVVLFILRCLEATPAKFACNSYICVHERRRDPTTLLHVRLALKLEPNNRHPIFFRIQFFYNYSPYFTFVS